MNRAVTWIGGEFLNSIREIQDYSNGFFTNIFATAFIIAATVMLH